jgi:hypothetical protein
MRKLFWLVLTLSSFFALQAVAQMVSPEIDRPNEPFSYFSRPTDVIGVMDAPAATLVSPEGFFYTGSGELMLFAGSPAEPLTQRVRTLERGYLPIIHYTVQRRGLQYDVTAFAATLDGRPDGTLVNFIRVQVKNNASHVAVAWLGAAMRYQSEVNNPSGVADNRFERPVDGKYPGDYRQLGERFNPDWVYGFENDSFMRGGEAMYLFPSGPQCEKHLTMKEGYNEGSDLSPRKFPVLPYTPMGYVQYRLPLKSGESVTLDFKMPVLPLAPKSPEMEATRAANFGEYRQKVIDGWEKILAAGIDIEVPEAKVNDTFKANLIYDLIARDKIGDDYIQTVNKFHYHAFWLRDSSYIVRMYDLSGYPDYARQVLDFFPRWQQPDGNFVSQGGQFDGWGQVLWAYGAHYRLTGDREFAASVFPSVRKSVEWLKTARAADPLHLIPETKPGDNEDIQGHVTGHNFWALAGLKNAIVLADAVGTPEDAAEFRREYDDLFAALKKALAKATATTDGYIPPGLDGQKGQDWGNMLAVYPEQILDPHDPMVSATLQKTREKYAEGIMTYGDGRWLHHYLTLKNTETETIRGDDETAIRELYALLVHTSSTHEGFEFAIRPWGTRDFNLNLTPHGWFAAKFRAALRNMMLREEGRDLHLLSVVSPEWLRPGTSIQVKRAPTEFGPFEFTLRTIDAEHSILDLNSTWKKAPEKLVLHLPWFMNATALTIDGKAVDISRPTPQTPVPTRVLPSIEIPVDAKHVEITWKKIPGTRVLNYTSAVEEYKSEFRRRYERFLKTGEN